MTTLAMIFGALPIALSLGNSSGSRTSLGIVVVGGLIFAGVLTLYVIPSVYSYFSRPAKPALRDVNGSAGLAHAGGHPVAVHTNDAL